MNTRPTIIFDFDGTIALGDGPVLAYAQQAADVIGAPDGFVDGIRAALAAGDPDSLDGYDAVRRAAEQLGADAEALGRAYLASRAQLGTPAAEITAPAGLADFLADAAAHAERVLVTNAPGIRLDEALGALGLAGLFDRIVSGAGKPDGLDVVLDALPDGARVLSVGDIWVNDLAPVHRRGGATALVGDFPDAAADPTFRAADLTVLLPQLRDWLTDSASASPLTPTTTTEG